MVEQSSDKRMVVGAHPTLPTKLIVQILIICDASVMVTHYPSTLVLGIRVPCIVPCQSSLKVKRCVHITTSLGMRVQDPSLALKI